MKKIIYTLCLAVVVTSVFADAPVVDYSTDTGSINSGTAKSFPMKVDEDVAFTKPVVSKSANQSNSTVEQRISKLERQVNHVNEQNLAGKIEDLQQRLQKANGQLEDQAHQIEQLNTQLKNFYQDLNQRLEGGKANSKKPEVSAVHDSLSVTAQEAATGVVPATVDDMLAAGKKKDEKNDGAKKQIDIDNASLKEQQAYQTAIDLLPDKKYEASEGKLRSYLKLYPNGVYVANAHYWLGEINFLQKNFDAAEEEFKIVVDKYSKSKRASDAMLKLALVHQHQGRNAQSIKQELNKVIKLYSGTSAAQLAKQQLAGG